MIRNNWNEYPVFVPSTFIPLISFYALPCTAYVNCLFYLYPFFVLLQNTKSPKGQIRFLVYCMENAILNLPDHQDQMVWLIDFHGFNMSHISVKVSRETAHVLQEHYPERLGLAVLYNPPKIFEPFWKVKFQKSLMQVSYVPWHFLLLIKMKFV